jgi:hypothetical protein
VRVLHTLADVINNRTQTSSTDCAAADHQALVLEWRREVGRAATGIPSAPLPSVPYQEPPHVPSAVENSDPQTGYALVDSLWNPRPVYQYLKQAPKN